MNKQEIIDLINSKLYQNVRGEITVADVKNLFTEITSTMTTNDELGIVFEGFIAELNQIKNEAVIASETAKSNFEEKGDWNAQLNIPTLSSNSLIGQTDPLKYQRYTIVVPGTLQFTIRDYISGSYIDYGYLVQHPDATWYYTPADNVALNKINAYQDKIRLNEAITTFSIQDNIGNHALKISSTGTVTVGPLSATSLELSGSLVNIDDYASSAQFNQFTTSFQLDDNGSFNVTDVNGNAGIILDEDGKFTVSKLSASLATVETLNSDTINAGGITLKTNPDYDIVITDSNGNIGWAMSKPKEPRIYGYLADMMHYVIYGQSLSVGQAGTPFVTAHQTGESYVYTFNKGPYVYFYHSISDTTIYNSLRLATELVQETPSNGMGRMIKQTINSKGYPINGTSFLADTLVSSPGQGGWSLAQLSKGQTAYVRFLQGITAGKTLSNAAGKTYNCPAVYWMQGENETGQKQAADIYRTGLLKLRNDLNADIKAINPAQKNDLIFLLGQPASMNAADPTTPYPDIYLMLNEIALNEEGFYPGPTLYPYHYDDNIHLDNGNEYGKVGALAGYILEQIIIEGVEWKGIHVESNTIDGSFIDLKFHVPVAPLVFETDSLVIIDPGNKGFRLYDTNGSEITINSVSLVRPDTVRIVPATTPSAGMTVTYALNGTGGKSGPYEGARGTLRDSQGDTVIYKPGILDWKLYNWCPLFKYILK